MKMRLKQWSRGCSIKFILLGKGTAIWLCLAFYLDISIGYMGVLMLDPVLIRPFYFHPDDCGGNSPQNLFGSIKV